MNECVMLYFPGSEKFFTVEVTREDVVDRTEIGGRFVKSGSG